MDGDVARLHLPIHCGRVVPLGFAHFRRDALSETLCDKFQILSYETLTCFELSLDLWYFCNVAPSVLGLYFREVVSHVGEWRGYVDVLPLSMLECTRLLRFAYRPLTKSL